MKDLDGPRYLQLRCQRRDCSYCGWLRDLEDATCLFLDAREQQPTMAITLTTVQPWEQLDPAVYRQASSQLWRELRRIFGAGVQYVGLIEFTTGQGERSGGHRRMHGHYLVKGIDPAHVLAVEQITRRVWERCTGAYVVEVSELRSAGGAIAYMGLHHRKPEQAAPAGWRGMRLRASDHYWHIPISDLREQARRHLAVRTAAYKLRQNGASEEWAAVAAELTVDAQREAIAEHGVQLVRVREAADGRAVVTPMGEADRPVSGDRKSTDANPDRPTSPEAAPERTDALAERTPHQSLKSGALEPITVGEQSHSCPRPAGHPETTRLAVEPGMVSTNEAGATGPAGRNQAPTASQ